MAYRKQRYEYVIARTASHRPSLMHRVDQTDLTTTACGLDMAGWSREYLSTPLDVMVCWRCEPNRNPRLAHHQHTRRNREVRL